MRFANRFAVLTGLLLLATSAMAGDPPQLDVLSGKKVSVEFEGWFDSGGEKGPVHIIHVMGQSNAADFVDALRKFFNDLKVREDSDPPKGALSTSEVIKLNITSEGKTTHVLLYDKDLILFGKDAHYKAQNTRAGTNTDFYEQLLLKFRSAWKILPE